MPDPREPNNPSHGLSPDSSSDSPPPPDLPKAGLSKYALQQPQIAVFHDGAIDKKKPAQDKFNLAQRVGPVYDIIRHHKTQTPLTIGIYGSWGTGKTSAMRWISGLLDHWNDKGQSHAHPKHKAYPVWFYPWKYQTKEDVWRGLIAEVVLHCISVKELDAENARRRLTAAAKQFGGFLGRSFLHALSGLKLKTPLIDGDLSVVRDIYNEYKDAAHPEKGYLNDFETTLKEWVHATLGPNERMVLFIDDLDRCLPGVTLQVLEAVKLYLGIERLIFVIGVDRNVVDAVVRKEYDRHGVGQEKADAYLDKMFQVDIDITPNQTQVDGFVDEQFDEIGALAEPWQRLNEQQRGVFKKTMLRLAGRNPRELKRLINSALIAGVGAEYAETPTGERIEFFQGVQAFLVGRVLKRLPSQSKLSEGRHEMLATPSGVDFFAQWSSIVVQAQAESEDAPRTVPDIRAYLASKTKDEEYEALPPWAEDPRNAEGKLLKIDQRFKPLLDNPVFRNFLDLLDDDRLGDLMQVPFSGAALAIASANSIETDRSIPGIYDVLITIARALGIKVEDATLADLGRLTELGLNYSGIGDAGIEALAKADLSGLKALHLDGTQVGDAGVQALVKADLSSLQRLTLNRTQVGDAGVLALSKSDLMGLQQLSLVHTQVGDTGIEALLQAELTDLKVLSLTRKNLSRASVKAFQEAYPSVILRLV